MTNLAKRGRAANGAIRAGRASTALFMLGALCGVATALPQAAAAQVAGGAQAGGGAPPVNPALLRDTPVPTDPPQCIHRTIDLRHNSSDRDANRLVVWLAVRHPMIAVIKASGSASGPGTGTIAVTVTRDGIPVGIPAESRGTSFISADTGASVQLIPGRQYHITAKATVRDKQLDLFDMYVGVGKTCP